MLRDLICLYVETENRLSEMSVLTTGREKAPSESVDEVTHELPFAGQLLEDFLDYRRPSGAPDHLTTQELIEWISSSPVKALLEQWKKHVVDDRAMRAMIQPGISTDYITASDTIDALVGLCYRADPASDLLSDDAFEATAYFAARIAHVSDRPGTPFTGLEDAGQLHWCYEGAVRLLITVFSDLVANKDGHFMTMLGGPAPPPITNKRLRIDNTPVSKDSEKSGPFAPQNVKADYSFLELGARRKAMDEGQGARRQRNKR